MSAQIPTISEAWDLAYPSFEGGFDAEQDAALIRAYNRPAIARIGCKSIISRLWFWLFYGADFEYIGVSRDLAAWTGDPLELAEDLAANSVARALRRARSNSQ